MLYLHDSKKTKEDITREMVRDRSHRWVGVPEGSHREDVKPELLMYPALTKLFTNVDTATAQLLPRKQFACIVSFFGDTGTGKSTIIQNLIRNLSVAEMFDVPVVGAASVSEMSTSGGIHVYRDPGTFTDGRPIVYAGEYYINHITHVLTDGGPDCEGLRGDAEPLANHLAVSSGNASAGSGRTSHSARATVQGHITRLANHVVPGAADQNAPFEALEEMQIPVSSMSLPWATANERMATSTTSWATDVVEKIYPRFLYVFSDVVCYVTGNSK